MTDRAPLKLALPPGEYQCYAYLPDLEGGTARLGGMLELAERRPPLMHLHGELPVERESTPGGATGMSFPQVRRSPAMRVELVLGIEVLLLDCSIETWLPQRAIVSAAAAIVGRAGRAMPTDDPTFGAVRLQVTGSDAVIASTPLARFEFPLARKPDEPTKWSAVERLPREVTDSDDGAEVSGEWIVSFSPPNGYELRIAHSPVIDIRLAQPISMRALVDEWIVPLRNIISLSTGRQETISHLAVALGPSGAETLDCMQVYGSTLTQQPFASDPNDVLQTRLAFNCHGDDSVSLLKLCRGWQSAKTDRHPLVETLEALAPLDQQYGRPRFLLLVQALEGLHNFANGPAIDESAAQHAKNLAQAKSALAAAEGLDPKIQTFVKKELPSRPSADLARTLRWVQRALPVDVAEHLERLELVRKVIAETEARNWSEALRTVRNDLSHGSRTWDRELLADTADLLERMARAHLMNVIGCPPSATTRALAHDR